MTQFKFLNNPQKIRKLLFIINIFVGLVACYLGIINEFPDADHYIKLGNNLSEGYFTSWHEFQGIYSETLRTPGYPIFLFLLSFISDSPWLVYFVQFVAYVLTILIAEKIVLSLFKKLRYVNCFYFLLIFNIQVPYYSGLVSAECLTILSVVTYLYILVRKKELTIKDWMWAAIVASVAFLLAGGGPLLSRLHMIHECCCGCFHLSVCNEHTCARSPCSFTVNSCQLTFL